MVHDHDVGRLCTPASFEHETPIEERTVPSQAIVDGRRDLSAQCVVVREILELREIAAVARLPPSVESAERSYRCSVARAVAKSRIEAVPAKIVAAPLEHRHLHRAPDDGSEQRE